MAYHEKSEEIVGECGVCSNSLPVGANHAYTVCKHLFCISCLLKWHKANTMATCPMCRAPLYEDEDLEVNGNGNGNGNVNAAAEAESESNRMTLLEMDFNQEEHSMHEYMGRLVESHVEQYCLANPMCTYMGTTGIFIIRSQEYDFRMIEVGIQNVNCHYVIELRDSSRAFRYKFGRIEDIRQHPVFDDIAWFVFRELIDRLDVETGYVSTVWSNETQAISMRGEVTSLMQYVPRMRMSM